jgi:hypothetical protein
LALCCTGVAATGAVVVDGVVVVVGETAGAELVCRLGLAVADGPPEVGTLSTYSVAEGLSGAGAGAGAVLVGVVDVGVVDVGVVDVGVALVGVVDVDVAAPAWAGRTARSAKTVSTASLELIIPPAGRAGRG